MIREIDKPEEPPKLVIKFANMVFVLGMAFSILLAVYATYKIYNPPKPVSPVFYIISILCGGVFAALFGLGLKRLSNNLKMDLSVLFFMAGISVYGFVTYLELSKTSQKEIIAKQMGVPYDTRSYMEVLDDLIDSGVEAYPNVFPEQHLIDNDKIIFNLGGISNITTVLRNESGYHPIVETDEHGFNNPKGLYKENEIDILLTGGSSVEGYSVHSDETICAVLRKLDFNAISVGKGGNGALMKLAALREYAELLKPKIVLWLYSTTDLYYLEREMKSSILRKYLYEDDYSQNSISRQEEIDDVLKNYVHIGWEKKKERIRKSEKAMVRERIINILKLSELRRIINLTPIPTPKPDATTTPIFKDILQKSRQMVSDWDGKMYLVYLPAFEKYSTGDEHKTRDFVMQTATELDIPIIDIHQEVFDPHPDPLSLFPFRMLAHYNAEGYRLIAEAIEKRLEADGYVPIKSKK